MITKPSLLIKLRGRGLQFCTRSPERYSE